MGIRNSKSARNPPAAQSRPEPAAQSRQEPAAQSRPEPAAQSRPEPAAQSRQEPAAQSRPEPAAQSRQEPAAQSRQEPAAQPAAKIREQLLKSENNQLIKSKNNQSRKENTSSYNTRAASSNPPPPAKVSPTQTADPLFSTYAEKKSDTIGPEGIEALCRDLNIEPTDIRILILAWKLQAAKQGFFTRDEWKLGMKSLNAYSIQALREALNGIQKNLTGDNEQLRSLYTFAFQYCMMEPMQKTLDLRSACVMLELLMVGKPHVKMFVRFLEEQKEYKVVTRDQWMGFLQFSKEVNADMSNYDESLAWPVLMDNFVEWAKTK